MALPNVRGAAALNLPKLALLCTVAALVSFTSIVQGQNGLQGNGVGALDAEVLQASEQQQDVVFIRRTFRANWHRIRTMLDEEQQAALASAMMDSGPLAAAGSWPSDFADGGILAGRDLLAAGAAAGKKPPPMRKPPASAKAPPANQPPPPPPQDPPTPPPPSPPPPSKITTTKKQ
jgi:hypothetical protein